MNQSFQIEEIKHEDRVFNLIQESHIPGGTKTRGLSMLIPQYSQYTEFVYAGPATGYAQIALSYCASHFGKKAVIYLSGAYHNNPLMDCAVKYGGKLIRNNRTLEDAQNAAKTYCNRNKKNRFLLPFGLGSEEFINILVDQFRMANPPEISPTKTLWLAVGSGTILHALLRIYPNIRFGCCIVGKKIWEDQFSPEEWSRITTYLMVDEIPFWKETDDPPPYDSLLNYDAKVWKLVKRYGKTGDYIFNVAGSTDSRGQNSCGEPINK
jgi:hypothetical protein